MARAELTAERVRVLLDYAPETGVLRWRVKPTARMRDGDVAGSIGQKGYRRVHVDGKSYRAHRLAWLHTYGRWPSGQIDHINGKPDDNRLANIRECSNAENQQNIRLRSNNTSGYIGAHWHPASRRWRAQIKLDGRVIYLGQFDRAEDASAAYAAAKAKLHKFQPIVPTEGE